MHLNKVVQSTAKLTMIWCNSLILNIFYVHGVYVCVCVYVCVYVCMCVCVWCVCMMCVCVCAHARVYLSVYLFYAWSTGKPLWYSGEWRYNLIFYTMTVSTIQHRFWISYFV